MFAMASKKTATELDAATLLAKIINELRKTNEKLDLLIASNNRLLEIRNVLQQKKVEGVSKPELKLDPDVLSLLSLPTSLRRTAMVLYKMEKATADEIAKETKRLRAVESAAANQLVRLGYLKKKREGRDVYFYIESSLEAKQ
jgi:hypothetical protein